MASLSNDKGGLRRIVVKCRDGKRRPLRIGRVTAKQAATIHAHVAHLESCQFDGSAPPTQTAAWLSEVSDTLRGRLVALGLAAPVVATPAASSAPTLGNLAADYKARPGWQKNKPSTRDNKARAFAYAETFLGAGRLVDKITAADATDFYNWLLLPKASGGAGLAVASANLTASCLFSLFVFAIDAELISRNPFKKIPRGSRKGANTPVSHAVSLDVLEAMEGTEGRLLFALSRWGGLRVPSEPRQLRWCDIDRERERMLIHSPKTERHEGHETRWVPIFPELAPLIQDRYDDAEPGEEYVLPRLRRPIESTATTMLISALRRCGVPRWKRLWHSLRASRQTELTERFPAHVVNTWLGNSVTVAERHYLMTLESHFEAAARNPAQQPAEPTRIDKKSTEVSVRSAG